MGLFLSTKKIKKIRNQNSKFVSITDERNMSSKSTKDLRECGTNTIFTLNQQEHIIKSSKVSFPNTHSTQVNILILEVGDQGIIPKKRDIVECEYVGYLGDSDKDKTAQFISYRGLLQLGCSKNIIGLERAIRKMNVGSSIKLWIPSKLAYGSKGITDLVPPDSNLFFHLRLIKIAENEEIFAG